MLEILCFEGYNTVSTTYALALLPTPTGVAAEPAWVAKFSKAAAGPEQFWIVRPLTSPRRLSAHPRAHRLKNAPLMQNYGASADEMVVGWLTSDMTAATTVQFGTSSGSYDKTATGNATYYSAQPPRANERDELSLAPPTYPSHATADTNFLLQSIPQSTPRA